jgi:hypothetical protein
MRHLIPLLTILCLITSCKDKQTIEEPDIDYGYDYFPLQIGMEWTYQVDSTIYDPTETAVNILTSRVYLREIVVDTFRDELNRLNYRLERFERPDETSEWILKEVWSALQTDQTAERFEENLRFVKLVFPVQRRDIWNGLVYIDPTATYPIAGEQVEIFKGWLSEVTLADEPEVVGDFSFDEVTTVQLADEENLLEKRYGIEKYAAGVGLVYRELEIYDTQKIDAEATPWEEKAEKGFKVVMTILDYR